MPHLDYSTFPGQVFWLFISFAALYFIVLRVIFPRVDSVLANRDEHIAGNLNKAEEVRKSAEAEEQKLAALLQKAAEESRDMLAKSVAAALAKSAERKAELSAKLDKKIIESEKRIVAIQAEAAYALETISKEISTKMVQKILEAA